MTKTAAIFDGKEKKVFPVAEDATKVIIHFKDVITAFGNIKQATLKGKGSLCCRISALLLRQLGAEGIPTHFVESLSENEQLCRRISLIPILFTVHNNASGKMADRLGLEEGMPLPSVVITTNYNNDDLDDPLINWDEIIALGIVGKEELTKMKAIAFQANTILKEIFAKAGIKLLGFHLEFGHDCDGNIIVSDEISPDTCALLDMESGEHLDKDLFRRDLGDIPTAYREVLSRLEKTIDKQYQ